MRLRIDDTPRWGSSCEERLNFGLVGGRDDCESGRRGEFKCVFAWGKGEVNGSSVGSNAAGLKLWLRELAYWSEELSEGQLYVSLVDVDENCFS